VRSEGTRVGDIDVVSAKSKDRESYNSLEGNADTWYGV
jgi:hypothetical protein